MKKNWDLLSTQAQAEYLEQATFLIKKGHSNLPEKELAKQIFMKSPKKYCDPFIVQSRG